MEEERLLRIAISRTVDPMQERGAEEMASEGERGAEGVSASSCGEWVKVICAWECGRLKITEGVCVCPAVEEGRHCHRG